MNILVTGGAGYIGSHTVVELLQDDHEVVIADDLSNSSPQAIERIEAITGKHVPFYAIDVCGKAALEAIFTENKFDAVMHFAGLKAVGESIEKPLDYYRNNIDSTLSLCETMAQHGVSRLIFSSSATVYGAPSELPLKETSQVGHGITNPYGRTKYMNELILTDLSQAQPELQISLLRYFNPIGAHESGTIGESPKGRPNNLLPYITQVAVGQRKEVQVFGNDYVTPDGTGVRDYIHVVDLARGHVAALKHLKPGINTYNLGTGTGVSVLELIHAVEEASGKTIPYVVVPRRMGDVDSCYADVSLARAELDWHATKTLAEACADSWRWQSQNPNGL